MEALGLGWKINDAHMFDKFFGMCVEGRQRVGKSSYVSQALAEANGQYEYLKDEANPSQTIVRSVTQDYESVKPWIVYLPKEFLNLVFNTKPDHKQKCIIWDDAGFWLFALDWYEPFVKSVSRYIQLIGRQFGSLILTTPSRKMVSQKVLDALPEMLVCQIHEFGVDSATRRVRIANVYERWDYPDGKHGGVRRKWQDRFNALVPDDYYAWYKPKSDSYTNVGLSIMKREVTRLTRKLSSQEAEEQIKDVTTVVGAPERLTELQEVIKNLETQGEAVTV